MASDRTPVEEPLNWMAWRVLSVIAARAQTQHPLHTRHYDARAREPGFLCKAPTRGLNLAPESLAFR
jgi:hypothetical protein